ncbi:MAG: energy transducer TonB [Dinghuibacter sp.]|nr:energy transducer TonB [Dinghuibacter sp.]
MKAEEILKSHWLDILFEHRNKEFGAYVIRRQYNDRMLKAVAWSLGITVAVFLAMSALKTQNNRSARVEVTDFDISHAGQPKPPEKLPPPVQKAQPPVKSVAFTKPIFEKAVPPEITSPEDLPDAAISNVTKPVGQPVGVTQPPVTPPVTGDPVPTPQPTVQPVVKPDEPLLIAEEMPAFPGGREELVAFLQKHLQDYVTEEGEVKRAVVHFIVEKDGTLTSIEITDGADIAFNKRVVHTIGKMPPWKPGSQNGEKVKVLFAFPIQLIPAED